MANCAQRWTSEGANISLKGTTENPKYYLYSQVRSTKVRLFLFLKLKLFNLRKFQVCDWQETEEKKVKQPYE